jgi:hypothetical protein
MDEQQTTGIKTADEMIERARRAGLTVSIETKTDEHSTVVRVEFGMVVPESAVGTMLAQSIAADTLSVHWYKSNSKGARWSMLTATRWQLTDHRDLKRVKDVRYALDSMGEDVARRAAWEAERQRVEAEPVVPQPVGAPEGITVKRGDMVLVELRTSSTRADYKREVSTEYKLMTVTGLTREGEIREVRDDRWGPAHHTVKFAGMLHATGVYKLLPVSLWDLARVLEAAKGHTYPQSTTPRCFESLEQARELLAGARLVSFEGGVMARADVERVRAAEAAVEEQQAAVSAPESAEEQPGAGTVPVADGMQREGVLRVAAGVASDEEASAEAERLVPRADHVVLRVVQGLDDREAVEERRFVVGVVASLLRAGARRSEGDGVLVLRWQGETTMVRLAA